MTPEEMLETIIERAVFRALERHAGREPEATEAPGQTWTVTEVAKYLKVKRATVYEWIDSGHFIHGHHINHRHRFIPSEVKAWSKKQRR